MFMVIILAKQRVPAWATKDTCWLMNSKQSTKDDGRGGNMWRAVSNLYKTQCIGLHSSFKVLCARAHTHAREGEREHAFALTLMEVREQLSGAIPQAPATQAWKSEATVQQAVCDAVADLILESFASHCYLCRRLLPHLKTCRNALQSCSLTSWMPFILKPFLDRQL